MNDIVNFISTVGFPIGSCLLCMYYIYKDKTETRKENLKREDKLLEQISKFNETMINFNITLDHFKDLHASPDIPPSL